MNNYLIVGLGNYPEEYRQTRHNVGYKVIDILLKSLNIQINTNKFNGQYVRVDVEDRTYYIGQPLTYMNLSGNFVSEICNFYKILPQNILVISDDADSPIGSLKLKTKGSSGGQNGLKDIINKLGTEDFNRLKIGIGRPNNHMSLADYVLQKFSQSEFTTINKVQQKACECLIDFMNGESIDKLLNKYNFKIN